MFRCISLLALFLLKISASKTGEAICETTEKCLCINYTNSGYLEYQCPPSYTGSRTTIHVFPAEKKVKIDCNETDILDGNFVPDTDFSDATVVELRGCPIPKNGFEEIAQSFRIRRLEKLVFKMQTSNETLKPEHFHGLEHLKLLDLSENRINFLNASIFKSVSNLTKLYLDSNQVRLTDGLFENCPNLQHLSLMSNGIRTIPDRTFEKLTNLTSLSLWMNKIEKVNGLVFAPLKQLKYLELALNDFRDFDEDVFRPLVDLRNVTLRRNQLRKISRKTFENNVNLERVQLHENSNLTLLDAVFSDFPRLRIVNLSRNNMRNVSGNLFRDSGILETISLEDNKLEELPAGLFRSLKMLKRLDLSNNRLKGFDRHAFDDLENLELLNLANNVLSFLDKDLLKNLKNLKEINLNYNEITKIDKFGLSRNNNLIKFFMGHNRFDFDESSLLSPFSSLASTNLREIDLSFNQITRYPYELHEIIEMKVLNLEHNSIEEISLENLKTWNPEGLSVNLDFNNISLVDFPEYFAQASVSQNSQRTTVKISENPINCDCRALNFVTFIQDKNHPVSKIRNVQFDKLDCSGPDKMRGIPLIDVQLEDLRCDLGKICTENQTCDCSFRSIDRSLIVDCSRRNLTVVPELTVENVEYFEFNQTEVHLEWNKYLEWMPSEYDGYSNVTKLYMQGNQIGNITWLPSYIKVLDLKYNVFRTMNNASLELLYEADVDDLKLGFNPWECIPGTEYMATFLQSHENKVDILDIKCNLTGRRIVDMQKYEFYPRKQNHLALYVIIALTCLFILTVMISIYYKFQKEIRIWLYAINWCQWLFEDDEDTLDEDKIYDALISYSHVDEDFVFDNLVRVLEGGDQPYKLCIHVRDWTPGEFIATSIAKSVSESRRTIVVLSSNFLKSSWGRMEFRAAHAEGMKEGRARVILIIYGDINMDELDDELKAYMKTNTYIKWGDRWFWEKLKYALPKRNTQKGGKNSKKIANMMHFIDGKFKMIDKPPTMNQPKIVLDGNVEEKSLTCIA